MEIHAGHRSADSGSNDRIHNDPNEEETGLPLREKVLVGLEGFVSLCGLGGGIYMATHPLTTMPLRYLEGTWFHTWRWPGLALLFFVGVCPALVMASALLMRREAVIGHLCVGTGLVAWVALEAGWMVVSPGLQIPFGAIGGAIVLLAFVDLDRSGHNLSQHVADGGARPSDYRNRRLTPADSL